MKFIILIGVFILFNIALTTAILTAQELSSAWTGFKGFYKKKYKNRLDEAMRFQVYRKNLEFISEHNAKADAGEVSFRLKMNQFGDMTEREFAKIENGFDQGLSFLKSLSKIKLVPSNLTEIESLKSVDYRASLTTPVKNQGSCGSCWSFSATGSIEGQVAKKTGSLVPLSEQQLIDCSSQFGNNACQGGLMDNAFRYLMQSDGLTTASKYPYEGKLAKCRAKKATNLVKINGFVRLPQSEVDLERAISTVGPISCALDSSLQSFQFYSSGIYSDPQCKNSQSGLNHALLVVGYGSENGRPYWIVKNSWGTTWGENGYFKLAKGVNMCGIKLYNMYPNL